MLSQIRTYALICTPFGLRLTVMNQAYSLKRGFASYLWHAQWLKSASGAGSEWLRSRIWCGNIDNLWLSRNAFHWTLVQSLYASSRTDKIFVSVFAKVRLSKKESKRKTL